MKRIFAIFTVFLLLAALAVPAFADPAAVSITTVEELELLRENPEGNFRLDADLDLSGVEWKPIDFSGTFDGNGHKLLNLHVTEYGDSTVTFWDGNLKAYEETHVAGFFGFLRYAEIEDLTLLGFTLEIDAEEDCFVGAIAGCAEDSDISGCTVSGTLTLRADAKAEGVGGIVGFGGAGEIEDCSADVTLICTDTNAEASDEQFLGGIVAAGFLDIEDCTVNLQGYVSEHGNIHCGGLTGVYRVYRNGWFTRGNITGNTVQGCIRFFEDSSAHLAYCEPLIGKQWTSYCEVSENDYEGFTKEESNDYSEDILPHSCEAPTYTLEDVTVEEGLICHRYTCAQCGAYSYLADYTLFDPSAVPEEEPEVPETEEEPAEESAGESTPEAEPEEEIPEEPEDSALGLLSTDTAEPDSGKVTVTELLESNGASFPLQKLVPVLLCLCGGAVIAVTILLIRKKK